MESIIGKQYGFWTVIAHTRTNGRCNFYKVRCICGTEREKSSGKLGSSHSCGCQNKAMSAKRQVAVIQDSGIRPADEQWQPDFTGITSGFRRVANDGFWETKIGSRVVDRKPMNKTERSRYAAQKAQQ